MPHSPRVLVLADHFGYAGGVVHGVTSYYLNVLPHVRKRGVELRCCFLREPHPVAEQLRDSGVPVDFLDAGKWDPFVVGRIEQIVRSMRANVLHVVGMKAAVLGRWVARRTGAALIIHSHDMNLPPLPVRMLYRFTKLDHERGLAVSSAAAQYMTRAYGIETNDVAVLPNAVDVSGIYRLLAPLQPEGLPHDVDIIVWIGRFHPVKGPQRMIRMMKQIAERVPAVQLVMVGNGPEWATCERLVNKLGLQERVRLLGQRTDVNLILKHVQVLCITSHNEGFSLVAAEAAASGVPVVAYSVGGLAEVVEEGITGFLIDDGADEQFIAAVERLLEDVCLRNRIGQQAQRQAVRFSMSHHVDMLLAEYQRAAAPSEPGDA